MFGCRSPGAACITIALTALIAGACVYDPGQRCGPSMTYVATADACVCDGSAIPVAGGCKPCAPDEVASAGTCGCAPGQKKNADNICMTVNGLGDPCDTMTAPCTDTVYSYCAVRGGGTGGVCTNPCTDDVDCDAAYTCATWEASPSCRTFTGAGDACGAPTDCQGDAKYCDSFMTHSCLVSGCSLTANDCPRDTMCCDFSRFHLPTLCARACP